MHFLILFTDDPDRAAERQRHMDAHLDFLDRNAARIAAAGPLFAPDAAPRGGAWLVDVPDAAAARALVHEDPFWPTGLRADVEILEWRRVFADGRRLTPG